MWLAELIGISIVAGVVLGIGLRLADNAWEKYQAKKLEQR